MIYAVNDRAKEHVDISEMRMPGVAEYLNGKDWRMIETDADGWIEWHGGECPLPKDQFCEAVLRSNICSDRPKRRANEWIWGHANVSSDIVAYRPIRDDAPEAEHRSSIDAPDLFFEAIGWAHAQCCVWLDEGKDPRTEECSQLILMAERAFGIQPDKRTPAWNGEGLPPVGTVCRLDGKGDVEIIAHIDVGSPCCTVAVYQPHKDITAIDWAVRKAFKPLPTDRERWVEAAKGVIDENSAVYLTEHDLGDIAKVIYDALKSGDLPLPE